MKSESEIREKIWEYMELAKDTPWWEEEKEYYYQIVDALLWVIGDKSGNPI